MSTKKIILSKTADWDAWFSFVRSRATNNGIWDLIDPDLDEKPDSLTMPYKPEFVMPVDDLDFNIIAYNAFKARKDLYKTDLALYEQQRKSFGDIITFIQETIAAHNVIFIQKEEPHLWNHLRALKRRLAPSDNVRCLQIEQKYHQLCKGPGTQDMETYLDHWTATYTEAKERNVGEATGTRPIRDFLRAIRTKEPTFADTQMMIKKETEDMYQVIEDFRQHIRLHQFDHPEKDESHSAFATGDANSLPTFRGQSVPFKSRCICGDTHWFSDCYYLVPDIRSKGWNPKPDQQKKVNDQLLNPQIKAKVDKALQRHKDRQNKISGGASATPAATSTTGETPSSSAKGVGAFTVQTSSF